MLYIRRRRARGLAVVAAVPRLILLEAVAARARELRARIVVGVLIQGDLVAGMLVAEDVATAAAVMTADKVIKGSLASRIIANGRLNVRLYGRWVSQCCTEIQWCRIDERYAEHGVTAHEGRVTRPFDRLTRSGEKGVGMNSPSSGFLLARP